MEKEKEIHGWRNRSQDKNTKKLIQYSEEFLCHF